MGEVEALNSLGKLLSNPSLLAHQSIYVREELTRERPKPDRSLVASIVNSESESPLLGKRWVATQGTG